MECYPYDARSPRHRSVRTALSAGQTLRLRLLLHRDAAPTAAFLRLRTDAPDSLRELPLAPCDEWLGAYQYWQVELAPDAGLYWYDFRYESPHGPFFVVRAPHDLGVVSRQAGENWQLTVCEADFRTPDWLAGGVIYQIFPDRYAASGQPKAALPPDRFCQTDWNAQPAWRQDTGQRRLGNDYYGGDLAGITEKLDDLALLGVRCLYLNPIFEAHANHRYNTADYFRIDPHLGTEADFVRLCEAAREKGIAVILDGVFSHTGDDSRYFNRFGRYDDCGAYQSPASPYAGWYRFSRWPDEYDCWWGVPSLPEVNETDPGFLKLITGENGVLRYWMRRGAMGWRFDVADELPDAFLDAARAAIKAENPDGFLLGEVWEDATNKISYGSRRRFLLGRQLDSVMNYPLANGIFEFLQGENARVLLDRILDLLSNYPPQAVRLLMNHIGTHDTPRALTRLGATGEIPGDRAAQAVSHLDERNRARARRLLRLAAVLQYTLPGVPSLYYGDEAGMEGWGDPFCRAAYPWGREDRGLLQFYRMLGSFRRAHTAFADGEFLPLHGEMGHLVYLRRNAKEEILVAVNRWCDPAVLQVPSRFEKADAAHGAPPTGNTLTVGAEDFVLLALPTQDN